MGALVVDGPQVRAFKWRGLLVKSLHVIYMYIYIYGVYVLVDHWALTLYSWALKPPV